VIDASRDPSTYTEEHLVGVLRQQREHRAARLFDEGDSVRFTVGQTVAYPHPEQELHGQGEVHIVRHHVPRGVTGTIVRVRKYLAPIPYVVLLDDAAGTEVGARELDLERIGW
jgi:hypothetical protein